MPADPRIHRALTTTGGLLLVLYAGGLLWGFGVLRGADLAPRPGSKAAVLETPANDGEAQTATRPAHYRVTAADGSVHTLEVSSLDPATALLEASQRFGAGATLERIDASAVTKTPAGARLGLPPWAYAAWLVLLIPAGYLWLGLRVRTRSVRVERIWDLVKDQLAAPATRVREAAGVSEDALSKALSAINRSLGTELTWDRHSNQILDARLSHFTLVLEHCPRCNARVHARVRADLIDPAPCPVCMLPFEGQELWHQRAKIAARLTADDPERPADGAASGFSLGHFALWSLLFPPVALVHAHQHSV